MASGGIVGIIGFPSQPGTVYATQDIRVGGSTPAESVLVYDFDDTTIEYLDFYGRLSNYAGGGLTVTLDVMATSATTGNFGVGIAFRRVADDAEDVDTSQTYDYNDSSATAVASAAGEYKRMTVTFTSGADMDSVADGDSFIMRIRRNTGVSSDATGDMELVPDSVLVKET